MSHGLSRRLFIGVGIGHLQPHRARAEDDSTARRIVSEAIQALGGERFTSFRDRIETGRAYSFYRERMSGLAVATLYTRNPAEPASSANTVHQIERQEFGKQAETVILYTPAGGWEITFRGATPLPQAQLQRYRESARTNVFYLLRARLIEPGMSLRHAGSEVLENQPVEAVEFTDSDNRVVTVYFHRSSRLPVRQKFVRRNPDTKERTEEVTLYGKYRSVQGIQWPFHLLRERDGEKIFELFCESVRFDPPLKENTFRLPPGIKMLSPRPGAV